MNIRYAVEKDLQAADVADLFMRSGINRPVEDLPRVGKMLDHANLIICARDGEKLVGIARSLTDFSFCCYLSDLAVDRDYQRKGIGKELVRLTKEAAGEQSMLLLLAAVAAKDYYRHIGFEKADNAWIIHRA